MQVEEFIKLNKVKKNIEWLKNNENKINDLYNLQSKKLIPK